MASGAEVFPEWWEIFTGLLAAAHGGDEERASELEARLWAQLRLVNRPVKALAQSEAYADAARLLPILFRHGAAKALNEACFVKMLVDRHAATLSASNTSRSKSLGRVSMRIEKAIVAQLQTLNDDLLRHTFFTVEGERFMRMVVASRCSIVLEDARAQAIFSQVWYGDLATDVYERHGAFVSAVVLVMVVPLNLPLLPLVAMWPPLGNAIPHCLGERFAFLYLLDVPMVLYFLSVCSSAMLAFWLGNFGVLASGPDAFNVMLLTWTASSLLAELTELVSIGPSLYFADYFNGFELFAYSTITSAYFLAILAPKGAVLFNGIAPNGTAATTTVVITTNSTAIAEALSDVFSKSPPSLPPSSTPAPLLSAPLESGGGGGGGGGRMLLETGMQMGIRLLSELTGGGGGGGGRDGSGGDGLAAALLRDEKKDGGGGFFGAGIDTTGEPNGDRRSDLLEASAMLLTFGVLALILSVFLRAFAMTPPMSRHMYPLVLLVLQMSVDLVKWMPLLGALLIATNSARRKIFVSTVPADCVSFEYTPGESASWDFGILVQWVLGDVDLSIGCLDWQHGHFLALPILMAVYNVLGQIFLLNTLIAMMALTFQRFHDNRTEEYQLHFAKMVIYWGEMAAPSPLSVLSLPFEALLVLAKSRQGKLRLRRVHGSSNDAVDAAGRSKGGLSGGAGGSAGGSVEGGAERSVEGGAERGVGGGVGGGVDGGVGGKLIELPMGGKGGQRLVREATRKRVQKQEGQRRASMVGALEELAGVVGDDPMQPGAHKTLVSGDELEGDDVDLSLRADWLRANPPARFLDQIEATVREETETPREHAARLHERTRRDVEELAKAVAALREELRGARPPALPGLARGEAV